MIQIPQEIIDATTFDDEGNRILKDDVTEEQRKIYDQFYNDLESGKLTDVLIELEK